MNSYDELVDDESTEDPTVDFNPIDIEVADDLEEFRELKNSLSIATLSVPEALDLGMAMDCVNRSRSTSKQSIDFSVSRNVEPSGNALEERRVLELTSSTFSGPSSNIDNFSPHESPISTHAQPPDV